MRIWIVAGVCALLTPTLWSGDQGLTPKDVAKLRSVASAELSPDGKAIAYVLSVPRELFVEENGPAWRELHVWDETLGSRPFIAGKVNVSDVNWTPDGKSISFLAKREGDKHKALYVIPYHGGESKKVLEHDTDIGQYQWHPDGNQVAFLAKEPKDKEREKLAKKGFNQEIYEEELRNTQIWMADLSGDEAKKRKIEHEGSAFDLQLSPNGDRIAAAIAPTSLVDHSYMYKRVYVLDSKSGEQTAKIENPGKLGMIQWSPDGKKIAMVAAADKHDPSAGRLYVADAKTGAIDKFFMDDKGDVSQLSWSDADTIYYVWNQGVTVGLRSLKLKNGKSKKYLDEAFPGFSHAPGTKRMALVGDTPQHPSEVYLWEEGQSSAQRVTNSNPWLDEIALSKQEAVTYKARDGLDLEGLLIYPLDMVKGKRYPLILVVHGGPEAHFRDGWITGYSRLGQMAAAKGFAVFYPNYRASTGRGVEFSKMDHGRPAMEEFDDLVDAVTHLSDNMGLVDKKKVGVTGGSYGGYATAWCATALTEHFAAGVMFVGISDKISKLGTSDIPDEVYLVHDRHRLWEAWDLFLKQSPIYHVEKANTPLLIMHGKDDPRVPPSQSLELYRALKTLNKVPVRLVWYPGEGHGNRKAAARYDYSLRALRWFETYLQGDGKKPDKYLDYGMEKEAEKTETD